MKGIRAFSSYKYTCPIIELGRRIKFAAIRRQILRTVIHLSGPSKVNLSKDQVIVLCLVKDAALVIDTFIDYYLALGVDHIVFLDNGSRDRTAEIAAGYPKVTVLRSNFPFRNEGDAHLKEYLTDEYGLGCWSLLVDIDEYFDFPHSQMINLQHLIRYLTAHNYTAVITQMLDMFPARLERDTHVAFNRQEHKYFSLDNIIREKYKIWDNSTQAAVQGNLSDSSFKGGIRAELFGALPSLTKHALIFGNFSTKRDRWGHFLDRGKVADISCVLLHYKFTSDFFCRTQDAVKHEHHFRASSEYKQYNSVLEANAVLDFPISEASVWTSVDGLIEEQFLSTSPAYEAWCSNNLSDRALDSKNF